MNPSIKRFVKKCEDFYICAEIGEKMAVGVEYADDRLTLYQYIVKGKISFNTIDGDNFTREICDNFQRKLGAFRGESKGQEGNL